MRIRILLFFFLVTFAPPTSRSYAWIYQITNDTTNDWKNDWAPSLYDGTIAWQGEVGGGANIADIYYWDGKNILNVTGDAGGHVSASLFDGTIAFTWKNQRGIGYWDGNTTTILGDSYVALASNWNGTIAWQGTHSSTRGIYYWNGFGSPVKISDHGIVPSLYDGTIAWNSSEGSPQRGFYYWNGEDTTFIQGRSPSNHNGQVAFEYNGLQLWDANTNTIILVDTGNISSLSLYNGTIAYSKRVGNDWEIFFWDGNNIMQVTHNDIWDTFPSLYDGTIAWTGWTAYVSEDKLNAEIYYWDGGSLEPAPDCTGLGGHSDEDGVCDDNDNCPDIPNPGQEDVDNDNVGDACDNCPAANNQGQEDADGDEVGDVCDTCTDTDEDGYGNPGYLTNTCPVDNCPDNHNPGQADIDGDGIGNACDSCDNRPITGSVVPSTETLWPPNHKMVPVTIDASGLTLHNSDTQLSITSVHVEEYSGKESGTEFGDSIYEENKFEPDFEILGDLSLNLRSERTGASTGRTYIITVSATDCSGIYTFTNEVVVPHDKGK
jgi:hypothetical protein